MREIVSDEMKTAEARISETASSIADRATEIFAAAPYAALGSIVAGAQRAGAAARTAAQLPRRAAENTAAAPREAVRTLRVLPDRVARAFRSS